MTEGGTIAMFAFWASVRNADIMNSHVLRAADTFRVTLILETSLFYLKIQKISLFVLQLAYKEHIPPWWKIEVDDVKGGEKRNLFFFCMDNYISSDVEFHQ